MTAFLTSTAFFPGTFLLVATATALFTGRVVDCRRGHGLLLKRQDSSFYYWFMVLLVTALGLGFVVDPASINW